jgi:hypothetical protein
MESRTDGTLSAEHETTAWQIQVVPLNMVSMIFRRQLRPLGSQPETAW